MDSEVLGIAALSAAGTYVATRVAHNERMRHAVGAGARGGEKVVATSASLTLKAGASVAAGAGAIATLSGKGLLWVAKRLDRAVA